MTRAWETIDSALSREGRLELRRRGAREMVIVSGGRVLMSSSAHRTEAALAELACQPVAARPSPRVLVGGLGMGFTLRAALDVLPAAASVEVAEIDPVIVGWCRGPLAALTGGACDDPRVSIALADVAKVISNAGREAGREGGRPKHGEPRRYDAILLDLYAGPHASQGPDDRFYGRRALARTRAALREGGIFAVWSEDDDRGFEQRLAEAGFRAERRRPGRGGPRHTVYVARA